MKYLNNFVMNSEIQVYIYVPGVQGFNVCDAPRSQRHWLVYYTATGQQFRPFADRLTRASADRVLFNLVQVIASSEEVWSAHDSRDNQDLQRERQCL